MTTSVHPVGDVSHPRLNRRRLLLTGPALAAASAMPAAALTRELSTVAVLFQQWKEYSAWLEQPEAQALSEEEFNAAVDVRCDLENQMISTPAQNAADVLMMIAAYSEFGGGEVPSRDHLPELWAQVRSILREGGAA